jgi:hypothetical protein
MTNETLQTNIQAVIENLMEKPKNLTDVSIPYTVSYFIYCLQYMKYPSSRCPIFVAHIRILLLSRNPIIIMKK